METHSQQNQPNEVQYSSHANVPTETAPVIRMSDWVFTILLTAIPIVNIIMLIIWAFGDGTNPSKANFAKASLLWIAIGTVISVLIFVLFLGALLSNL
jgi:hypothetical protein